MGDWAAGLALNPPPDPVIAVARRQLLEVAGLCVAARKAPYVKALMQAEHRTGDCTLIGHGAAGAAESALINGTAAHGEDFDDTFEGTPVHTGSTVVPAVLAACEDNHRSGADLLAGISAGVELM
ncbi:MAG: MmgE/PrpD family protein, partial [Lysobacterales bacterium]